MDNGFYTMKGYQINEYTGITTAMEDYLEMICRMTEDGQGARVGTLSQKLHVKPSSVSKMVQQLADSGYIRAEKYGIISLTERGTSYGDYLLYRHEVLNRFLCMVNKTDNELEEVEKIEHFLRKATVENIDRLTKQIESDKENR